MAAAGLRTPGAARSLVQRWPEAQLAAWACSTKPPTASRVGSHVSTGTAMWPQVETIAALPQRPRSIGSVRDKQTRLEWSLSLSSPVCLYVCLSICLCVCVSVLSVC
eukprot:SAG31_NODE_17072_length_684_cov_1.389744_2_plen_106_part_01